MGMKSERSRNFKSLPSFCDNSRGNREGGDVSRDDLEANRCRSTRYNREKEVWTSPVEREANDFAAKKRVVVLDMIAEKNWKNSIRSKIESDLSNQVAQALEPIKSRQEDRKNSSENCREMLDEGDAEPSFKYINSNNSSHSTHAQLFTNRSIGGRSQNFSSSHSFTDTSGLLSESMYQFDQLKRRKRHNNSSNNGGLNFALIDADSSNIDFLAFKSQPNGLRPLIFPGDGNHHEVSIPDYGINRRCFQSYTKEGMSSLLNSKSRRNKLTSIGNGQYMDKRGIIISKLGPFWPQGYGPVCQNPEFAIRCPSSEELGQSYSELLSKTAVQNNYGSSLKNANSWKDRNSTQQSGKIQWRGKPVIFDCDRSLRAPIIHSLSEGFDESLIFESRFESGNLRQVRRIGESEYELVLRTDMYTNRHTQWFYFRLQKVKPGQTYKFNIINFLKKDSLYNYGMRPLVYSETLAKEDNKGWFRSGENIRYTSWSNPTRNSLLSLDLNYFCLEMEISFDWKGVEEDTIYMAHCYPYTYTDLRRHLEDVMQCPTRSLHVRKEILCETAAGNACFLLTVTEFPKSERNHDNFHNGKKGVVVTARVHPGETQASWMMKGVIDFLTSNHPNAAKLRKKYIFKIVPMLNPDGVIVGNYRTSLAARDLNRNYRHPRQETFPTVWYTKQMVDDLNKNHPIILYCDLHGHSRRHLVFMYGCERRSKNKNASKKQEAITLNDETMIGEQNSGDNLSNAKSFVDQRLFPWLMHRLTPSRFSFHETKYAIRRSKESTGRVVMFKQLGILNSFTLEASFSGTPRGRHFNIEDFLMIGRKLCESVLEYSRLDEDPVAKSRVIVDMTRELADHAQQIALKQKQQNSSADSSKEKTPSSDKTKSIDTKTRQILSQKMSSLKYNNSTNSHSKFSARDSENEKERELQASHETDKTCYELLQNLEIFQFEHESDASSESNSDSEPELSKDYVFPPTDATKQRKNQNSSSLGAMKKRKRKKNKTNLTRTKLDGSSNSPSSTNAKLQNSNKSDEDTNNKSKFHEDPSSQNKNRNSTVVSHPTFVNRYANRSNGGIPIFAQERMNERATRRMAEMKLIEEERRQHQLFREEIILSGLQLQSAPFIPHVDPKSLEGYSEFCGVRYNYGGAMRRSRSFTISHQRDLPGGEANEQRSKLQPSKSSIHGRTHPLHHDQPNLRRNAVSDLSPFRVQQTNGGKESLAVATLVSYGIPGPDSNQSSAKSSNDEKKEQTSSSMKKNKLLPLQQREPVELNKLDPTPPILPIQRYGMSWNGNGVTTTTDKSFRAGSNSNNFFDILRPRKDLAAVESPEQFKQKGLHPEATTQRQEDNSGRFQLSALQLTLTGTANNKKPAVAAAGGGAVEATASKPTNQRELPTKVLQEPPMKMGNSVIVGSKLMSRNQQQQELSPETSTKTLGREDGARSKKENDFNGVKKAKLKSRTSIPILDEELREGISGIMTTLKERRDDI